MLVENCFNPSAAMGKGCCAFLRDSFCSGVVIVVFCFLLVCLQLVSGDRCACCGFPTTASYKHLKNVACNQCPFYRFSLFFSSNKNLLICFGNILLFVTVSSELSWKISEVILIELASLRCGVLGARDGRYLSLCVGSLYQKCVFV